MRSKPKKTVYSLMYKSGTYKWNPCCLREDDGSPIKGGRTENKELVIRAKALMEEEFPDIKYAILELEV